MVCPAHTEAQIAQLVGMLQKHDWIMISSGNALPPPAYGIVCNIDAQGHDLIKERALRVPLHHMENMREFHKVKMKARLKLAFAKPEVSTHRDWF